MQHLYCQNITGKPIQPFDSELHGFASLQGCLEQDLLSKFLDARQDNRFKRSKLFSSQRLINPSPGLLIPASRVPCEDGSILRRVLL